MGVASAAPKPDEIRRQLARVVGSPEFDASERNRRFLEHVVEESLAGRADRIKAYSVATSVFERDETFDPQIDPIVRIEARRLRQSLERYYLTAGREDRVFIEIPKGDTPRGSRPGRLGPASRSRAAEAGGLRSSSPPSSRKAGRSIPASAEASRDRSSWP